MLCLYRSIRHRVADAPLTLPLTLFLFLMRPAYRIVVFASWHTSRLRVDLRNRGLQMRRQKAVASSKTTLR